MSKTLVSVLVVAVVLVGGYFVLKAKNSDTTPVVTSGEQATTESAGKKMAFSDFIKQGGTYKCEVKQAMSDFENNGTIYMNGANVRGEFSTVAEGRTMDTSYIFKDGYAYNWSSMTPSMGFKMKINTSAGSASADASQNYTWDAGQVGDYNCTAWTVDESKFTPPANITFKDMTQMTAHQ